LPAPIGVLALQGDFREHRQTLAAIDEESIEVRTLAELAKCRGLIIPGGESTVMQMQSLPVCRLLAPAQA